MRKTLTAFMIFLSASGVAQDTPVTQKQTVPFTFSGYLEGYYSYDFNKPSANVRPGFLYNYNRHNEFNVNLGFISGSYNTSRVRANLAIAVGTYMNANYAAEPAVLKNIYEANAGFKLSSKKKLWLDIGIMPSHIGFEGAVGKNNWTLTRSLVAENSPYFESGARLSYGSDNEALNISVLALNGWQRITRIDANSLMSWGAQVYFKPKQEVTVNYSVFFGTDKPDSARLYRYYHNVYGIFQLTDKVGLTAGFDIGMEDKALNDSEKNRWYTPVFILRFTPNKMWALALRGEYFADENSVIIATGTPNGFKTSGWSANIDYLPVANAALRLEIRHLNSKDKIFTDADRNLKKGNTSVTFSFGVSF